MFLYAKRPSTCVVALRAQDSIGAHGNLKPQKRRSLMFAHAAGSPKLPTPTKATPTKVCMPILQAACVLYVTCCMILGA